MLYILKGCIRGYPHVRPASRFLLHDRPAPPQLTPTLTLSDIPYVIPALRMQQSRLDYYCDVAAVPTNSPFAACLSYVQKLEPLIEREIYDSEETLQGLIDRLGKMGLAGASRCVVGFHLSWPPAAVLMCRRLPGRPFLPRYRHEVAGRRSIQLLL